MGNSIFDWDDDEKQESDRPEKFTDQSPEPVYWNDPWKASDNVQEFEQPVESVDHRTENLWENPRWSQNWDDAAAENGEDEGPIEYIQYQPESADETARRGGLAWSAGIVFFSAIVFMLFIGWGADRILGSSPWGIVGGIVLGSLIGFVQFFRISSQIFNPAKTESAMRPLMPRDDDDYRR